MITSGRGPKEAIDSVSAAIYDTTDLSKRDVAGRLGPGRLMVGVFRGLAILLFVLCVFVALLTTNIRFLFSEQRVSQYAIDDFGAVAASGIDRNQLLHGASQMRQYFRNNEDTLSVRVKQGDREVSLFNPRETSHLKDVKFRLRLQNLAQEFSVVYVIAYMAIVVLWAREVSTRALAVQVAAGSILTLAVIGGLGAVSLAGFDSAWERLHLLIFSNDFWRLNPQTDHLIQMFPLEFWQNIVFFLGVLVAAEAALLLLGAAIFLGVTSRQPAPSRLSPSYT